MQRLGSSSNDENELALGGVAAVNESSPPSSSAQPSLTTQPAVTTQPTGIDQNFLLPRTEEALVLSLNVLEVLLPLSAPHINTFATKERLSAMAALLYR